MNVHSGVSSIALVVYLGNLLLFDALGSVLVEFLVLLHDFALAALALSTSSGTIGNNNNTVSILSFWCNYFVGTLASLGKDLRQFDIDSSRLRNAVFKHGVVELVQAGTLMPGRCKLHKGDASAHLGIFLLGQAAHGNGLQRGKVRCNGCGGGSVGQVADKDNVAAGLGCCGGVEVDGIFALWHVLGRRCFRLGFLGGLLLLLLFLLFFLVLLVLLVLVRIAVCLGFGLGHDGLSNLCTAFAVFVDIHVLGKILKVLALVLFLFSGLVVVLGLVLFRLLGRFLFLLLSLLVLLLLLLISLLLDILLVLLQAAR